jgi:hypothetical protein
LSPFPLETLKEPKKYQSGRLSCSGAAPNHAHASRAAYSYAPAPPPAVALLVDHGMIFFVSSSITGWSQSFGAGVHDGGAGGPAGDPRGRVNVYAPGLWVKVLL